MVLFLWRTLLYMMAYECYHFLCVPLNKRWCFRSTDDSNSWIHYRMPSYFWASLFPLPENSFSFPNPSMAAWTLLSNQFSSLALFLVIGLPGCPPPQPCATIQNCIRYHLPQLLNICAWLTSVTVPRVLQLPTLIYLPTDPKTQMSKLLNLFHVMLLTLSLVSALWKAFK